MDISLRYLYNKTLVLVPDAKIADERVAPLHIQWVGSASPKFASHGGFLYFVADESEVPSLPLDPADTFGCVVLESLAEQCRGIPRIVVPDACDLDKLFDFLVREHLLYRDWHDLISNLLVSDASYQELVNATAEFVPRPMYIADASWRMISRVDFEMGEISATWHYQMLHDGLYPYHIVEALNRTGDYYRISNLPHAALIDSEVYTMRILAKPIRYRGRLVGYYFMIDTWGDLGECEVEIAETFGTMIAPIMAARGSKESYASGFQDNFILHMLGGLLTNKRDIAYQLKTETRWPMQSDFRLVTVHFGPDEYENHLLHMRVMGMLMGNFDSHAYSYKDMAVAIFHRAELAQEDFGAHLEKCASALKRVVVVSSRFSDFSQLASFYEQNTYVHEQLEMQDDIEPRVVSCDEAFLRLLANCCKGSLPSCYGADVLYSYDRDHGTSYCETLLEYLVCERNAVATAQTMFLHRNTLRNRLNKIDELIGTDLDNADERMRLIISLNTLINAAAG